MDKKDDRIFTLTRIIAALVVPFLWLAFLILFFYPSTTGEHFAWTIKPELTSVYLGAGYLGGSWLFINAIFGKRWHRIQGGFLPVTTFTWFMLAATILHWDRFAHGNLAFILWLILYAVTPFLVPALWLYNRRSDPRQPEDSNLVVSPLLRWIIRLAGIGALLFVVIGFIFPNIFIQVWPWTLTPLTARVMAGWGALLSVGALGMAADSRWSAWRTPLESILIWHVLFFIGSVIHRADLKTGLVNWYSLITVVMVIGIVIFYPIMEMRRKKKA